MKALELYELANEHIERRNFALAKLLYLAGDELTTIEACEREWEELGDTKRPTMRVNAGEETEMGGEAT